MMAIGRTRAARLVRAVGLVAAGCALLGAVDCARAPSGTGSGVRLVVTLQFANPVNPIYHYFFLIRNGADQSGVNGPIAVIQPGGNGFATDAHLGTQTAAFTDFVVYDQVRQLGSSGYGVYHLPGGISGNPNRDVFVARGVPDVVTAPTSQNPNVLQYELDLSRLQPDSGEPDPNNGQTPRYLQINAVATTTTPKNPQIPDPDKYVDAFGDQHQGSGTFNLYLTIDTSQIGRTYQSSSNPNDLTYEPDNDTYPSPSDPAIELVAWSVQIIRR